MATCDQVVLKNGGGCAVCPGVVAIVPRRFVAAFTIKPLSDALAGAAGGRSERK